MMTGVEVHTFVNHLLLLPLVTWRDAALACPRHLATITERALADAIHSPGLALDVWNTRDDVDTAFCRFDCAEGHALLRTRGRREHVHFVSERAALAALVREALCEQDFNACYGGFAQCIALTSLRSH